MYPPEDLVEEAVAMGARIASKSLPISLMAKEAVNAAFESSLAEGIRLERRMFHSAFALVSFFSMITLSIVFLFWGNFRRFFRGVILFSLEMELEGL